jgi:hypothetical protein
MIDQFIKGKQPFPMLFTGSGGAPAPASNGALRWLLKPLAQQAKGTCIRYMNELIRVAPTATDLPDFKRKNVTASAMLTKTRQGYNVVASMLLPSLDRSVETHFRVIANKRMAAALLAARLYELDTGHPPQRLEDLVPAYLPAVPSDPLADNAPIRFRAQPEPIVWSVGANGVDDNAAEAGLEDNDYDARKPFDFVRHLNAFPRNGQRGAALRAPMSSEERLAVPLLRDYLQDPCDSLQRELAGVFSEASAEGNAKKVELSAMPIWKERAGEYWLLLHLVDPNETRPELMRCVMKLEEQVDGSVLATPHLLKDASRWAEVMEDASKFVPSDFTPDPGDAMFFSTGVMFRLPSADGTLRLLRIDDGTLYYVEAKGYDWKTDFEKIPAKYVLMRQAEGE